MEEFNIQGKQLLFTSTVLELLDTSLYETGHSPPSNAGDDTEWELGLHLPLCLRDLHGGQLHLYLNLIKYTCYDYSCDVWSVCSLSLDLCRVTQKWQLTRRLFCSGFEPLSFCLYGMWSLCFARSLAFLTNFLKPASYSMLNIKLPTFCPHYVFVWFLRISEQTAITSLYSINWLVFKRDGERLLRGTDWVL